MKLMRIIDQLENKWEVKKEVKVWPSLERIKEEKVQWLWDRIWHNNPLDYSFHMLIIELVKFNSIFIFSFY